jgi:hypothetical protein
MRIEPEEEISRLEDLATMSGVSGTKVAAAPIEVVQLGCGSLDQLRLSLTGSATLDQGRRFFSKLRPQDLIESVRMTAAARQFELSVELRRVKPH